MTKYILKKLFCIVCGEKTSGSRWKYCSNKCVKKFYYLKNIDECIKRASVWNKTHRARRIKIAVESARRINGYYQDIVCKDCHRIMKRITKNKREFCAECLGKRKKNYLTFSSVKEEGSKAFLLDIFGNVCEDCKNADIRVLEIHHVKGAEKRGNGRRKFTGYIGYVKEFFQGVDLKLLCSNCHIIADIETKRFTLEVNNDT